MTLKNLFKKPKNDLELPAGKIKDPAVPDNMYTKCNGCKGRILTQSVSDNDFLCPQCGFHYKMPARARIKFICDEGTFSETDAGLKSENIIGFPDYDNKLASAMSESGENEGVITGCAEISGVKCAVFAMESRFMMGSMGSVVGEKITRLFEYAITNKLPVIGYTVSGGARMQEGILSLMQMAKTSCGVKRHSDCGLLYVVVLTDPTTGGVTASFAMEGDIIIAEPNALIGFGGPRVIEQTIRQKLPAGFQKAEFLLKHGFLDMIVDRTEQKKVLADLLRLHIKNDNGDENDSI